MEVSLYSIVQVLIGLVASLLLAVGTWALNVLRVKLGIEADHQFNTMLNEALMRAVAFAKQKALERAGAADLQIDAHNQLVADAANYVLRAVPSILQRYGITEEHVQEMVTARLSP